MARKLKPVELMLVHLLNGKCRYFTGHKTTHIAGNIWGQTSWLESLWFKGWIQIEAGAFDYEGSVKRCGHIYEHFNNLISGVEIWLTEAGRVEAERLKAIQR